MSSSLKRSEKSGEAFKQISQISNLFTPSAQEPSDQSMKIVCVQDNIYAYSIQTDNDKLFKMDDASSKFLCIGNNHGNCKQDKCTQLHSDTHLPYLWQIHLFGGWFTLPNSESVEQMFCSPGEKEYSFKFIYASEHLDCKIVFVPVKRAFIREYYYVEIRRLSTMSFNEAGDVGDSFVTQWRWYWKENDEQWMLFEPDSVQHTLEAKYLAKQTAYLYWRDTMKYKIDFDSLTQHNVQTGETRPLIRRPVFVSYKDVHDNIAPPCLAPPQVIDVGLPLTWVPWDVAHPFELVQMSPTDKECIEMADLPQWKWYWQDSNNTWKTFVPDSLQQTLDTKFLANQSIYLYSRENYKRNYSIDFKRMTQKNVDTGAIRKLQRRNMSTGVPPPCLPTPHVIDVERPESWVPWDVAHPFELVLLPPKDPDCIHVSNNFYQTMSPTQHVLEAVFRVQNHTLWSAFCNQEKSMLNNQRRLGDTKPVDKRYLFHGTDSLDTVRGICINNFDFRLCRKNATVYGKGAYFSRDAKYSHRFTKPSAKLERFMFQAQVLVGYYTTGNGEYKRPPNKPGKHHELYDTCVDKVDDPSIFILFEKNAYYPECLIQYNNTGDTAIPL